MVFEVAIASLDVAFFQRYLYHRGCLGPFRDPSILNTNLDRSSTSNGTSSVRSAPKIEQAVTTPKVSVIANPTRQQESKHREKDEGQNQKTIVAKEAMGVDAGMKEDESTVEESVEESTVEESVETIDAVDSHESDD